MAEAGTGAASAADLTVAGAAVADSMVTEGFTVEAVSAVTVALTAVAASTAEVGFMEAADSTVEGDFMEVAILEAATEGIGKEFGL
jgi:hypothetical protein